jgi:hypothetical protein
MARRSFFLLSLFVPRPAQYLDFAAMTSRKKPGAAFWATAALLVALVGYALAWGPAWWLVRQHVLSEKAVITAYTPVVYAYFRGPAILRGAIGLYSGFSVNGDGRSASLEMRFEDWAPIWCIGR